MERRLLSSATFLLGALCAAALAAAPANAGGKTKSVKCDKGQSIQKKLDKSKPGTTLEITGTCNEDVLVTTDNVTLMCIDGASIIGTSRGVVDIRATNVTVNGCTISGDPSLSTGIIVLRSGSAVISGNTLSGLRTGVTVSQASYGRIIGPNQTISGNSTGIAVSSASHADVAENVIDNNSGTGILVTRGAAVEIVDNDITNNGSRGVSIGRASAVEFSADLIFGNAPNRISGNGSNGIACFSNSAVRFGVPQDYTGGNTGSDFFAPNAPDFSTGCDVFGTP